METEFRYNMALTKGRITDSNGHVNWKYIHYSFSYDSIYKLFYGYLDSYMPESWDTIAIHEVRTDYSTETNKYIIHPEKNVVYNIPKGITKENLLKLIVAKYLHTELLLDAEPRLRDLMPLYTSMLCGPKVSSIVYN